MECKDCNRFSSCEIISEMVNLRDEIHSSRKRLQPMLSQSPKEIRDKYKEQQKQLTTRRLELRKRQCNCLRKRNYQHYLGYRCFKPKKRDKENRNMEDNQNQVLDSYF